jgi:hypothetical protein
MLSTDTRRRFRTGFGTVSKSATEGVRTLAWSVVTILLVLRRRFTAVRVRAHLRRTERALRATDTDHLDADQRRRREDALDALRAYRERGAVPTNEGTNERAPQFVGANGVPCAVAALALADDRSDIVERVAALDNGVRLETVGEGQSGRGGADGQCGRGDPAGSLPDWLDETGLTRAEAARIQPAYPSEVLFATDCGPVSCALARALVSTVAIGVFTVSEVVGYRLVSGLFPENPFKRRGTLAYLTVMNCLLAPLVGVCLYTLFP